MVCFCRIRRIILSYDTVLYNSIRMMLSLGKFLILQTKLKQTNIRLGSEQTSVVCLGSEQMRGVCSVIFPFMPKT